MTTGKTNIDKIIEDYVKLNNKIIENNGIIDAFDKMNESIQKTREELEGVNNSIFYLFMLNLRKITSYSCLHNHCLSLFLLKNLKKMRLNSFFYVNCYL